MKLAKTLIYGVLSFLLMGLAVWIVAPMYNGEEIVTAYLRSDLLLFMSACGVLGVGVYSHFAYTKQHREHRRDTWFFVIVGALLLVVTVIVVVRYGGISEQNFDEAANAAVNLNVMLAGALPLPFMIRTAVLAGGVPREKKISRVIGWSVVAVAAVFYIVLIATGRLWNTIPYETTI